MGVDHLDKRLARLAPKAPPPPPPKVEFITVPPTTRRGNGARIIAAMILGLAVALAAKGLLLAQLGVAGFDEMRQNLAEGSPWQRGLALALRVDPVSHLLAQQFGLPGPEDTAASVRLNHESSVTLIEVEQPVE